MIVEDNCGLDVPLLIIWKKFQVESVNKRVHFLIPVFK